MTSMVSTRTTDECYFLRFELAIHMTPVPVLHMAVERPLPDTVIALVGLDSSAVLAPVVITDWFNTMKTKMRGRQVNENGVIKHHFIAHRWELPRGMVFQRRFGVGIKWKRIVQYKTWSVHEGTNAGGLRARFVLSKHYMIGDDTRSCPYHYKPGDIMLCCYDGHLVHDVDIDVLARCPKLRVKACELLSSAALAVDAVADEEVTYDDVGDADEDTEVVFFTI